MKKGNKTIRGLLAAAILVTGLLTYTATMMRFLRYIDRSQSVYESSLGQWLMNAKLFGVEGGVLVFFLALWFFLTGIPFLFFMYRVVIRIVSIHTKTLFFPIITSTGISVGIDYLNPKRRDGWRFFAADDEKLVVRHDERKFLIFFMIGGIVFSTFVLIGGVSYDDEAMVGVAFAFILLFGVILAYLLLVPPQQVVFDRMTGMVTLPRKHLTPVKLAFKDVFLYKHSAYTLSTEANTTLLAIAASSTKEGPCIPGEATQAWWSWYVQYMDKNRPLPNGTLLDAYRKKDYERRKAEGFPPPLYESRVEIMDTERIKDEQTKK